MKIDYSYVGVCVCVCVYLVLSMYYKYLFRITFNKQSNEEKKISHFQFGCKYFAAQSKMKKKLVFFVLWTFARTRAHTYINQSSSCYSHCSWFFLHFIFFFVHISKVNSFEYAWTQCCFFFFFLSLSSTRSLSTIFTISLSSI